jgi:hypothetical protein
MDRRRFTALMAIGLLESLRSRELLAASGRAALGPWFRELTEITRALRSGQVRDLEFQAQMQALFERVDLAALAGMIDFDAALRRMRQPARGYLGTGVDLRGVSGQQGFGARLFVCRKGRSIVPHGHANMCTGFIVLRGSWRGRHYEKIETGPDHLVIAPTIDRTFAPGDVSTISDHRDNVHWFSAESDTAFIFNVHVAGYDVDGPRAGRVYVDPLGSALVGGRIRAPRLSAAACFEKFG